MSQRIRVSLSDFDSDNGVIEKVWHFDTDDVCYESVGEAVDWLKDRFDGYHLTLIERVHDPKRRRFAISRTEEVAS